MFLLLSRALPMGVIFSVLTGPGELWNWILGAALALVLGAASSELRPIPTATALRAVFLPWLVIGVLVRVVQGTAQLIRLLVLRRAWSQAGLVTCPGTAAGPFGRGLLALMETVSPGSIVVSADNELRVATIDAHAPKEYCRKLQRWYAIFQRPMTG